MDFKKDENDISNQVFILISFITLFIFYNLGAIVNQ